ncbi:MAG TPA: cupin domain-containing protein [Euzebya sp.]|nr:cupin domain-containing protein [Euzebya sp.]
MRLQADDVATMLGLSPLQGEGGRWGQTWLDEHSSAIYFLLAPGDFSALHKLPSTEVYHVYAGDPMELAMLHPDGSWQTVVLGPDLAAGQRPTFPVPGGTWQGSCTLGDWTLLGTTMAPPFSVASLELGDPAELRRTHPGAAEVIVRLTR